MNTDFTFGTYYSFCYKKQKITIAINIFNGDLRVTFLNRFDNSYDRSYMCDCMPGKGSIISYIKEYLEYLDFYCYGLKTA